MKVLIEYLYCCFYYLIVVKNFRHVRATFAISISITLYILAICIYVSLYVELYKRISALIFFGLVLGFGVACFYFLDGRFGKRDFYSHAIQRMDSKSTSSKRICGLIGGLLFIASWAAVIFSFLAFGHRE